MVRTSLGAGRLLPSCSLAFLQSVMNLATECGSSFFPCDIPAHVSQCLHTHTHVWLPLYQGLQPGRHAFCVMRNKGFREHSGRDLKYLKYETRPETNKQTKQNLQPASKVAK